MIKVPEDLVRACSLLQKWCLVVVFLHGGSERGANAVSSQERRDRRTKKTSYAPFNLFDKCSSPMHEIKWRMT